MLNSRREGALSRRRLSGSSFEVANPLARLYAMGIDAYRITPRLPTLAKSPGAFYPGQTGGLSIDSLGRVQRQLALGRFGEIDLVMRDGATLVFVEVRYRRSDRFGAPAETVDRRKQQRLTAAANHYLQAHPTVLPCRFDVVAVSGGDRIEWIKNAFAVES
jgi:uncharacterized protein (TIGR00252 family)